MPSLAQAGTTATVAVLNEPQTNVLAELDGRNDNNVVMAGAHLDSVEEGPGINDNGSGSAALIEVAENLGNFTPENTLRFAWWGAEEAGLVGSHAYVDDLSQAERDRIALYMNYDMIGSPNYIFMVYDADQSTFPAPPGVPIPAGSAAIEDVYERFYTIKDEPYDDTEFSGRSDYEAFILADIPASGLFTGAEEIKTRVPGGALGRHGGRAVRPVLPRGLRHVRQRLRARARRQQRQHRVRRAQVRLLDRDGERRPWQARPGLVLGADPPERSRRVV